MIISLDNGNCGRVIDADGKEVEFCVEADLETGDCLVFRKDSKGEFVLSTDKKEIMRFREKRTPPLTLQG